MRNYFKFLWKFPQTLFIDEQSTKAPQKHVRKQQQTVALFLLRDRVVKQTMNLELFRLFFKREKKKAFESSRGSAGLYFIFCCYFFSEQKCWQEKQWNYISYSWSGTRPQAKKGNVLLYVTYWRDKRATRLWKREKKEGGNRPNRERKRKGAKSKEKGG